MEISVIICTRNPRPHYLRRVLDALRNQTLPLDQWDLLLVDNGSTEPLTPKSWDLSWHPRARHVREDRPGVAAARQRGLEESTADVMLFVDDDNVLDANYLFEAVKIKHAWPILGVWGCSIVPEFEVPPPAHLREFLSVLALREIKTARWSNLSTCDAAEPWGAGMCVRAPVAAEYYRVRAQSTIHIGSMGNLLRGEDTEICYAACSLGLGMGVFPTLTATHLIPKERLEESYLLKITEGIQTSLHLLNFKWQGVFPQSPFSPMNILRLFLQIMQKKGIHRRMYFASVRARINARRAIAAAQSNTATPA